MGWIASGVMALLAVVAHPGNARAQGSIFGTVQNTNLTSPAVGTLLWVGFLDNTDEEIRIESNTGAGYDGTFWFDDFQNYSTEVAGNPYDYIFTNTANGQYFRLEKLIPNNSFQQEDVLLAAVAGLPRPIGLTARVASLARINLSWNFQPGATYHVYRRATANNSSFRRLDNPAGNLASIGVPDSFFVDATSDGASDYTYIIIGQTAGGIFTAHSVEVSALASTPVAPAVSSVTPDSAGTTGGVAVTVRGTNFDMAGASITFGGNAASNVVVASPFVLTCTIPPGVAGFANVVVTNTGSGLASAPLVNGFRYVVNGAPIANAGTDIVGVTVGSLVTLNGTASHDPDLNPLRFHWLQILGPAVILSDSTVASPTFTPFVIANFRFRLLVDDGQLLSLPDTVSVQVMNQPPVLATIGALNITEGALLSVLITATDPDGAIPALTVRGLPAGATFADSGNGRAGLRFLPVFNQSGQYALMFTASDGVDADSEAVTLNVLDGGNQRPVLDPIGPKVLTEGSILNVRLTASDLDLTTPVLSAVNLPLNATFQDSLNGRAGFAFSPNFSQSGGYQVTFIASDGVLADSEVVLITVVDQFNQAPVFDPVPPISVLEGDTVVVLVHAVDPEGGTILMGTLNSVPNAVFVDSGNGHGTVTYRPSFLQAGADTLRILAVDNGAPLATQTLKIAITTLEKNQAPNLWLIGSRTVLAGDSIKIRIVATDSTAPAGNQLFMAAINLPVNASYQDSGGGVGKFKFKPTFGQIGSYNITFIATDNGNPALADLETVTFTVQNQNQAPVLANIGAKLVNEGDSIGFNVSATDPDGTIPFLTCAPTPLNGTFVDSGNGHGRFQFKPSFVQSALYQITFTASDGLLSAHELVLVQVKEAGNQTPILGQLADSASVVEKSTILILVSATDPDGGHPALAVSPLLPNATFADSGNGTGVFRMTPDYWQDSVYTLLFTATDVQGKKDSATVVLTVIDAGNQRPFILPIAPPTVIEKNSLVFSVTAKDSDLTIPTLVARPLPPFAAFSDTGSGIGVFSWVPDYTDAGTHNVYFVATDAESSAFKDSVLVPIVVLDRTRSPQFNASSTNGIAVTMALGDSITIWYHAFDPDGPAPKMTVTNLRPHMSFVDSGNGFVYLSYKPTFSDLPGVYSVNFIAKDSVYDTVSVSLNQVFNVGFKNVPPRFAPIGPKTVMEGDSLIFVVTATDSNGTVPFVTASNLPTNATFTGLGGGLGRFRFLPSFVQSGIYYPLFRAQDGSGAIDTQRVAVTVLEAGNHAPVWVSTFPIDTIRLSFVSSYKLRMAATDIDNPLLTLVAVGAPVHSTFTDSLNNAASFIFNPDSTQVGQIYPILFIARDGTLADTAVVIIKVLSFMRGDWNRDRVVDVVDVVAQVNYTFRGAADPVPFDLANYNGDAIINVLDLVILIDFVFRNGPPLPP